MLQYIHFLYKNKKYAILFDLLLASQSSITIFVRFAISAVVRFVIWFGIWSAFLITSLYSARLRILFVTIHMVISQQNQHGLYGLLVSKLDQFLRADA